MAEIRIPATVLRQKDKELYLFKMKSSLLNKITYVTPRSEENPDELQRVYSEPRAKEIGAWIKEENSLLPNAIVVDFKDDVEIEPTADPNIVTITIPNPDESENPKLAYILDGQHRVKGFDYSDGVEFDLAVIAVHNVSDSVRGKIFIDINSKQVKVDERLLLDLMAGTKSLAQDDDRVYQVIKGLDANTDSPLHGKIQFLPEQKNKWVKNTNLFKNLKPHISNGGVLYNKTTAQQIEILSSYFTAFKTAFPTQWDDSKNYVLTRNQGIELMCGIFREVKHRCDLYERQSYTRNSFVNQVKVLCDKSLEITLEGNQKISIPLDWNNTQFGKLSTRQWMAEIRKLMVNILNDGI
ncbi:MAG TPA: DGQHR domain-containing protein [Anaerolineales bacterium]|nr:DGQHR domain-containing protein [Anaerolineales bacterium]